MAATACAAVTVAAAVYVFLFDGDKVYAVKNTEGKLGVPGGGVEPTDASLGDALKREFLEETGQDLRIPIEDLKSFSYINNKTHARIAIYYARLSHDEALVYVDQAVDDPACDEVEVMWTTWADRLSDFRPYTKSDFERFFASGM